jgi:hypothetical protein
MKATRFLEMLISTHKAIQIRNPEDHNIYFHRRGNLKYENNIYFLELRGSIASRKGLSDHILNRFTHKYNDSLTLSLRLSSHLLAGLASGLFPRGFRTKILKTYHFRHECYVPFVSSRFQFHHQSV